MGRCIHERMRNFHCDAEPGMGEAGVVPPPFLGDGRRKRFSITSGRKTPLRFRSSSLMHMQQPMISAVATGRG